MISLSQKTLQPTTVRIGRLIVLTAGVGALAAALYRAPAWLDSWHVAAVAAVIGVAATVSVLAVGVAIRGSAKAIERVALEIFFLGCGLLAAEAILLARSPETWTTDPQVQTLIARERTAFKRGIEYDGRMRSDVVRDLRAAGFDAVPGFAPSIGQSPVVAAAIRERGLLPLTNPSNVDVVECNEGPGYLQYRTDELGFNNPPGLARGPVDVAAIGESFTLGHCVPPASSAVALLRARYPRTANFGVAGSRVLWQLGVFREYVAPIEPPVVVWFVNVTFADPREEASQPMLLKYVEDGSFSQRLRTRQSEVDSFVREVLIPLNAQRDETLSQRLAADSTFPVERLLRLGEIRKLTELGAQLRPDSSGLDLSYFERVTKLVADSVAGWGGRLVVVILPRYQISTQRPVSVAQYRDVRRVLEAAPVALVDGVAVFDEQPDELSLYTMRTNNHPSERGHALIAEAVIAAVEREKKL
jgi:hypothetical protein